jgi:hypothetical protein
MPGSYRPLTNFFKVVRPEKVKEEEAPVEAVESESISEKDEGTDGKWTG